MTNSLVLLLVMHYLQTREQVYALLSGSGKGPVAASSEHDNEPLGSTKGKLLDELSDC
jgi:hypothetical protein